MSSNGTLREYINESPDAEIFLNEDMDDLSISYRFRITSKEADGHPDEHLVASHRYLVYSGYSGGPVERANVKAFREICDGLDVEVYEIHGGYGTTAVGVSVSLDDTDPEAAEEIVQLFDGLTDYPAINDEAVGEEETSQQDEAWDSWVARDFVRELEEFHDIEIEDYDSDILREVFEASREEAGVYWDSYSEGVTVDVKRVAEATTCEDLADAGIAYEEEGWGEDSDDEDAEDEE